MEACISSQAAQAAQGSTACTLNDCCFNLGGWSALSLMSLVSVQTAVTAQLIRTAFDDWQFAADPR